MSSPYNFVDIFSSDKWGLLGIIPQNTGDKEISASSFNITYNPNKISYPKPDEDSYTMGELTNLVSAQLKDNVLVGFGH